MFFENRSMAPFLIGVFIAYQDELFLITEPICECSDCLFCVRSRREM